MFQWISIELGLLFNRRIDFSRRDLVFFCQARRHHRNRAAMKEVQQSVVYMSETRSQFVNIVSQIVGFRPSQLMPQFSQTFDSRD